MGRPIYMSLISNLRPLAKGFDLVKGCSLAKGSHGPSSSSCWAWHEPPGPPHWQWHDFSSPAGEAARSGGGPDGVGCAARVEFLDTDPNWSWAGSDSQEQRARSRDDRREWTWCGETGWQHTGGQAPLQKGKGAGKGKQGLGKGQGGGGKGKGGGKPSQRLPQLLLLLLLLRHRRLRSSPQQDRRGPETGGTPSQEGPVQKAPKPKQKAMPAVAKAKGAGPAVPLLLRATPKPLPAPPRERDGRTVYKFILFF